MKKRLRLAHSALWLTLLALLAARAGADAIVWSRAMLAPTIAEYYVEPGRLRVDLEIGVEDLDAFRNLMPDEIYERLGHPPEPFAERLGRFYANDFAIAPEGGEPLRGRILEMGPRERARRDEITGEPLPPEEGEEAETVVFARIEYALPERPAALTLLGVRGPKMASVGFVLYHRGIAVNDFRYLTPAQTVDLDWQDPWYTSFRTRALRRQYFAPMSGFIYVEPYEVRKEIIARPGDLQGFVDLGLEGRDTIPVEIQPEVLRGAAAFLREHHLVTIDGREVAPELARVNFLERTLRTSRVIDPPVELDLHAAMLGVIFVYPTEGLPERVTMDWDLWNERIQKVPVSAVDQAGPLPSTLEPDWRILEWNNVLKFPELPTLQVLAPPPSAVARWIWTLRWVLGACALVLAVAAWRSGRGGERGRLAPLATAGLVLVVAASGLVWARGAHISDQRAGEIVSGLLRNVYLAFDFRGEEQIYDVLEKSVVGDLLATIYLETQRGLELANQGGARAKVKEVELVTLEAEPAGDGAFVVDATWNVGGSVGHWGHVHQRRNQYRAELRVAPVAGTWKLADMKILEEERL
jgi:hypothetical protein